MGVPINTLEGFSGRGEGTEKTDGQISAGIQRAKSPGAEKTGMNEERGIPRNLNLNLPLDKKASY